MFRSMRRKNQELTYDESLKILEEYDRGILALLGDEDYPYTVPMNHLLIDDKIYFHGSKVGHKIDAIKNHDKASYCVMDSGVKYPNEWWYTFRSVIAFGRIKFIEEDDKKLEILNKLGDKYFPSQDITQEEIKRLYDNVAILELGIEHLSGKTVKEK